jgi:ribosomal protein S18 acetylase RimI-like enzyme
MRNETPANTADGKNYRLRSEVLAGDDQAVRRIVTSTNFFSAAEIEIAVELVQERLTLGSSSSYRFVFAMPMHTPQVLGYGCFGEIPCTVGSYDLYWIAVDPQAQGIGLGRQILSECERQIRALRGRRVFIETSGRTHYGSTQQFYLRCGYTLEAEIADFYSQGDAKLVYGKRL